MHRRRQPRLSCAHPRRGRRAILFCDIRNFTAFAESHPAYDVIHLLNRWYVRADEAVRAVNSRIDNVMGDGFLAPFGEARPETAPRDAVREALDLVLAARVEAETKTAGVDIFLTQAVWNDVKDAVEGGKTVDVLIKGKSGRYALHEVRGSRARRLSLQQGAWGRRPTGSRHAGIPCNRKLAFRTWPMT
jgi:class 3 adenylate cyclase